MKCPKNGCDGAMYRFRPKHLVAAWYRTGTDVLIKLDEPGWRQVGLMCGHCGYMEFYAQEPKEALAQGEDIFECTETLNEGGPRDDASPKRKES